MKLNVKLSGRMTAVWVLAFFAVTGMLGTPKGYAQEQATEPAEAAPAEVKPAEVPFEPKTVTEGMEAIDVLMQASAPENVKTPAERMTFMRERCTKAISMVEKIMTLSPSLEERTELVQMKLQLLSLLSRLGAEGMAEKTEQFLEELINDADPAISKLGKTTKMGMKLSRFHGLPAEEQKTLAMEVKQEVLSAEPTLDAVRLAMSLAQAVGYSDDVEMAVSINNDFADFFESSTDEKVKSVVSRFRGAARRLGLPGNEITIVGKTVDGETFDFTSLRGKVVLVDFWATWCGPCIREFPNMKKMYSAYKPHGFEIVGISLDDDHEKLMNFIVERDLPWVIMHNAIGEDADGWDDPNARYYGVSGIPTMIMVGRDGKVISTKARGPELEALLAKEFPDVKIEEETEAEEPKSAAPQE